MSNPPSSPDVAPPSLKRWQAIVGALVGGVLAQAGSVVFVVVGLLGLMAYHGKSSLKNLQNVEGAPLVLAVSALATSGFLLVASVATPWLAKVKIKDALGLFPAPAATFPAAALGALSLGPIGGIMREAIKKALPNFTLGNIDFINDFAASNTAFVVFPLLAIMPAVCEEVFFRGMLQRALGTSAWAIVVSGVTFAFFHVDPHHVVAVLPVGLYMAWLAARTGSTFVPIAAHLTNNSIAIIALQLQDTTSGAAEESVPLWMLPPAVLATVASVAIVWYATKPKRS